MVGVRSVHSWEFDVTDWTSTSIGKNELLWLVAAKSVDMRDHYIWHHDNIPTTPNNFHSCVGAISLGPSGNLQGGFKLMALNTGNKIVRRSWGVIPMPNTVITCVNAFGSDQPEQFILPINMDVQSSMSKS